MNLSAFKALLSGFPTKALQLELHRAEFFRII
jgi:hypothetical protein